MSSAESEIKLIKQIDVVLEKLFSSEFSDKDIDIFTETMKIFLRYTDLKHYILDTLYEQIKHATHDTLKAFRMRNILRAILKLEDQNLINIIETFFLKDKKINLFFILLQEKISLQQDIKYSEKQFLSALNTYYDINLEIVNEYLQIIGKDKKYFVRRLMDDKIAVHTALSRFIKSICILDAESLRKDVVPVLVQEFVGNTQLYMSLCRIIVSQYTEFTKTLLENRCDIKNFSTFVLDYGINDTMLIKNYCEYLTNYDINELENFENSYILRANPDSLIAYARFIDNSNKRKVLRRLISLKSEDSRKEKHLVYFIEYFPEFSSLLPML